MPDREVRILEPFRRRGVSSPAKHRVPVQQKREAQRLPYAKTSPVGAIHESPANHVISNRKYKREELLCFPLHINHPT